MHHQAQLPQWESEAESHWAHSARQCVWDTPQSYPIHGMRKLEYLSTNSPIHHLFLGVINNPPLWFTYPWVKHVNYGQKNSP